MTKVFINDQGVINTRGEGNLASITELEDDLCVGGDPIEELIEVVEGIYQWIDLTEIDEMDFVGYQKVSDCINNKIHKIA